MSVTSRRGLIMGAAAAPAFFVSDQALARPSRGRADDRGEDVRFHTMKVGSHDIFYRDAGHPDAPVILLLHGFPASSFMFRDLMPRVATRYRVIAPDYPGFGYSSALKDGDSYTFDTLADVVEQFCAQLQLHRFALYMQDFGGPIGFRLAAKTPKRVTALIIQNANAYEEGLPDSFWKPAKTLWADPSQDNFAHIKDLAMSDGALEWNYAHGAADPSRIDPDNWTLQKALLAEPGAKDRMAALLYDYRNNLRHYAEWQAYFRAHRPPTLIAWGKNDVIFPPEGARAYLRDLPKAELHLFDTGHFALEEKSSEIASLILDFGTKHIL